MGTTARAGRRMCSTCTLSSEKFENIPALKNSLREIRAFCFSLCAKNTDEGRVKRLFQPPCMKPIYVTPGRLSLPRTTSHPQSAPAAAWPGFHAVSAQHRFLCHVSPFAPPKRGVTQWERGCGATLQPQTSPRSQRPAVTAALPKGASLSLCPVHRVRVPWGLLCKMLSGLMWALHIQSSFAIESSEVMKAHVNYAPCSLC